MTTEIHPTAIVDPCVELGANVQIGPYAVIGLEGEIRDDRNKEGTVLIGDGTIIRAHVTVDRGTEGNATIIGPNSYLMTKSHVGHDVKTEEHLTLSSGAKIGGGCLLGHHVNIGLNAVIHQRLFIGSFCMIGMGAVVIRPVPDTLKVVGSPARIIGHNDYFKDYEGYDALKEVTAQAQAAKERKER